MLTFGLGLRPRTGLGACAAVMLFISSLGAAQAAGKTYTMKITVPTLHDAPYTFCMRLASDVEKDSGGRIKAHVYPASQLGSIPRQIEGTQFGSIQVAVIPPDFFVGVDPRFEVMAAPGLIETMQEGDRIANDPQVLKLMLSLGANKGLHGVAMFLAAQSQIISRDPIRHLDDFKGKKIRVFASDFQKVPLERLGATPVAMTLGDVLPALQEGTIDGAVAAIPVYTAFSYWDVSKYVTVNNQPAIFIMVEVSSQWFMSLPPDLQKIVTDDARKEAKAINPWAIQYNEKQNAIWKSHGGELIHLPPTEQAKMMKIISSVAPDLTKSNPTLRAAYDIVAEAAKKAR